jgi:DNA repair protein RadC
MADLQLTAHLKEALNLVDIKLLDHLIVSNNKAISLAEEGHM